MRAALERTPTLRARVFTDREQAYCDQRQDPTERYAARFAAKEAVLKAMGLGLGACGWREIEVARAESGVPSIVLHGGARAAADELRDPVLAAHDDPHPPAGRGHRRRAVIPILTPDEMAAVDAAAPDSVECSSSAPAPRSPATPSTCCRAPTAAG